MAISKKIRNWLKKKLNYHIREEDRVVDRYEEDIETTEAIDKKLGNSKWNILFILKQEEVTIKTFLVDTTTDEDIEEIEENKVYKYNLTARATLRQVYIEELDSWTEIMQYNMRVPKESTFDVIAQIDKADGVISPMAEIEYNEYDFNGYSRIVSRVEFQNLSEKEVAKEDILADMREKIGDILEKAKVS